MKLLNEEDASKIDYDNAIKGIIRKLDNQEELPTAKIYKGLRGLLQDAIDNRIQDMQEFFKDMSTEGTVTLAAHQRGGAGSLMQFKADGVIWKITIEVDQISINDLIDQLKEDDPDFVPSPPCSQRNSVESSKSVLIRGRRYQTQKEQINKMITMTMVSVMILI